MIRRILKNIKNDYCSIFNKVPPKQVIYSCWRLNQEALNDKSDFYSNDSNNKKKY